MKLRLIISTLFIGLSLFTCQQDITIRQVHTPDAEVLMPKIVQAVQDHHFSPRTIDDKLSQDMFTYFIEDLDPQKEFFTQKDLAHLSMYNNALDEAVQQNNFDFFNTAVSLLEDKVMKVEKYSNELLKDSYDFSKNETLEINFSKLAYASNDKALKNRWRKKLKKYLLDQMYVEEMNNPSSSTKERLPRAKENVQRLLSLRFNKLKNTKAEKRIEAYANAFLKVHDFQSQYLSPKEKSKWDENFTRSFVGIGVRLEIENAYPKVTNTIVGGPAWKTKSLEANDKILRLKEKDGASIDLMGRSMEEIINLLKGKQGTSVYLTVENKDAQIKEVKIQRDKIEFDLAMSFILETNQTDQKIGYIRLPRFYTGDPGSAAHVLDEINTLKANRVAGIIFDVRNNHGGSAGECRELLSFFLNEGIYIQTKRSNGDLNQFYQDDTSVLYDGKLVVLTNARSGSASELFSGTLQDYKRALIVGGESTYGKGSVQNFVDMNMTEDQTAKFGQIKMSVALFYTASGRSPQSTGIIPDIQLTDDSKYVPSGERAQPFSMAADTLPETAVRQNIYVVNDIDQLKSKSSLRTKKSKAFQIADEKAKQVLALDESNLVELELSAYQKQRELKANLESEWKKIYTDQQDFKVSFDKTPFVQDTASIINRERWIQQIKSDPYIYECYQIINDMAG